MSQVSQNVAITLSASSIQVVPGETYELGVTVINNSREVERFELGIVDLDPSWYQFDWADVLLYPDPPGNESTSYARITIPPGTAPGTYAPTIMVTGNQFNTAQHPLILVVNQVGGGVTPDLALQPDSLQTNAKVAQFRLNLKNPLNSPVRLQLLGRSARPDAQLRLVSPVVDIPPFAEKIALIEVRPLKPNWIKAPQRFDFSVAIDGLTREVHGFLIQTCRLAWLRKILITPLLLAAAIILPLLIAALIVILLWPRTSNAPVVLQAAECVGTNSNLVATLRVRGADTDVIVSELDGARPRLVVQEPAERLPGNFASLLSISPDGSTLAYVTARNEALDDAFLYTLNLNSPNKQRVTTIPAGLWPARPIWSGDSNQLSYVVRNGSQLEMWVVNLASGDKKPRLVQAPTQLTPSLYYGDPGPTGPLCWSTDNTRLVIRPQNTFKQTEVNVNTGQLTPNVDKPNNLVAVDKPQSQRNPLNPKEPTLAPLGQGACFIPNFSQNDPQWRSQPMRKTGDKIGETGCPLTTAAIMLNYYKINTDPNDLNSCLGEDASPFDWSFPPNRCSQGLVQGGQREDFSFDKLNEILKRGQPVIVGLLGGQTGSHFVVVSGGSNSIAATYRVNDPWDGTNYKSLAYFLEKGYQLRWLINYTSPNAPTCPDRTDPIQKFQPGFQLIIPTDGGMYNTPIQVSYIADQDVTVVGKLSRSNVSKEGEASPTNEAPQPVSNGMAVSQEGLYVMTLENAEGSARLTTHFTVDITPPIVALAPLNTVFEPNPDATTGRFIARKSVPLEFRASDNLTGIASIQYQINGAAQQTYNTDSGTRPISIDKAGDYDLVYWAIDGADNRSPDQFLKFSIVLDAGTTPIPGVGSPGASPNASLTPGLDNGSPTPTPTPTPPGALTATPPQLTFDASQNSVTLQLINSGAGPAIWTIQQLVDPAATYLDFGQLSGNVPAGGALPVTIQLRSFNVTAGPIIANFNISYNNNTAFIPIIVTINPQPAPTVVFAAPATGPLTNRSVGIQLQVTPKGLARPNHATIFARYIDQPGGQLGAARALPAQLTEQGGWTYTWDTTLLPPQPQIDLSASICWSADESNCVANAAVLNGLSIPKPSAIVTLNPASDKLYGTVTLTAQLTGDVDHISYKYTTLAGPVDLPPANKNNNFTVKWDTTVIPPQGGIVLTIAVCWTAADDPLTCSPPTNQAQIPAAFTVEAPVMTLTPLLDADSKELPLQLALSGTASKINNPATAIFIVVSAAGTTQNGFSKKTEPLTQGSTASPWTLSIDTSKWQPNAAITFASKICWDGNLQGAFCTDGPTLTANISAFSATFADPKPTTLATPANLVVTPVPAKRIAFVKFIAAYTNTNLLPNIVDVPDKELNLQATIGNKFTVNFDSVAQGVKPGTLTFKLQACADATTCGDLSAVLLTLPVPNSALTTPLPLPPTFTLTGITQDISGKIGGRGASEVSLLAYYKNQPDLNPNQTPKQIGTAIPAVRINDTARFSWVFNDVPPQSGMAINSVFCWQGGPTDFDPTKGCFEAALYSNLSLPEPKVTNFYANIDQIKATPSVPYTAPVLLVPITDTTQPVVRIPVSADVTNFNNVQSVNWQVQLSNQPAAAVATTTTQIDPSSGKAIGWANLTLDTSKVGAGVLITITASPVWTDPNDATHVVDYKFNPANVISIPVKLVSMKVSMDSLGGPPVQIVPATSPNKLMYRQKTTFTGTLTGPNGVANDVKKMLFYVSQDGDTPKFLGIATPTVANNVGSWSLDWDHGNGNDGLPNPRPGLSNNISLIWRLCNSTAVTGSTDADPVCTPLTIPNETPPYSSMFGSASQANGLKLVGIQFDPGSINNLDLLSPNGGFFNSTYTATVMIQNATVYNPTTNPNGTIKQIRMFAFRTTLAAPDKNNAVPLVFSNAVTNTVGLLNLSVVDLAVNWPATHANYANLLGGAIASEITISTQFCTNPDPTIQPDDASCSDWTGREIERTTTNSNTTPPWKAYVNGKQAVIVSWLPYHTGPCPTIPSLDPCPPFEDYIMPSATTSADLKVNVYEINKTLVDLCDVTPPISSTLTLAYATKPNSSFQKQGDIAAWPKTTSVITPTIAPAAITSGCSIGYTWQKDDILSVGLPIDAPNERSLDLKASVVFTPTATAVTNQAAVSTHGLESGQPNIIPPAPFLFPLTLTDQTKANGTISWSTNVNAYCTVAFTPPLVVGTFNVSPTSASPGRNHTLIISNFQVTTASTVFSYNIICMVGSPTVIYSSPPRNQSFTMTNNVPPVISTPVWTPDLVTKAGGTITWNTGTVNSSCTLPLGSVSPAPPGSAAIVVAPATGTNFTATLTGFSPIDLTNFTSTINCTNTGNNVPATPKAALFNFPDNRPPVISVPVFTPNLVTKAGGTITWNTGGINSSCTLPVASVTPAPPGSAVITVLPATGTNFTATLTGFSPVDVTNFTSTISCTATISGFGATQAAPFNIPDNRAPVISVPVFTLNAVTKAGGTITWDTGSVNSNCTLPIGSVTPAPPGSAVITVAPATGTNFTATLTGFSPIAVTSFSGIINCTATVSGFSATPQAAPFTIPDNIPPVISLPVFTLNAVTNAGGTITWNTGAINSSCTLPVASVAPAPPGSAVITVAPATGTNFTATLTGFSPVAATTYNFTINCTGTVNGIAATPRTGSFNIPDNRPPNITITGFTLNAVTKTGGTITWNTGGVNSSCTLPIASVTPVAPGAAAIGVAPATGTNFTATLTGFTPVVNGTTYSYTISCSSTVTGAITTANGTFLIPDNQPPTVTFNPIGPMVAGNVNVGWNITGEPVPATVSCTLGVAPGGVTVAPGGATTGASHTRTLSGMLSSQNYVVTATCTDNQGNVGTGTSNFTTPAAPNITGLTAVPAVGGNVTVAWSTLGVPTNAQVTCNSGTGVTVTSAVFDVGFTTTHTISLPGLTVTANYTCTATSISSAGYTATAVSAGFTAL